MSRSRLKTRTPQNRSSRIRSRETMRGALRTETIKRDEGTSTFAVSTDPTNNRTAFYIDSIDGSFSLSGSEARTVYRLLKKHYRFARKSR